MLSYLINVLKSVSVRLPVSLSTFGTSPKIDIIVVVQDQYRLVRKAQEKFIYIFSKKSDRIQEIYKLNPTNNRAPQNKRLGGPAYTFRRFQNLDETRRIVVRINLKILNTKKQKHTLWTITFFRSVKKIIIINPFKKVFS